ncbi:MAG TPA: HAMP domain-containing sensor histidine kinase [Candidatus Limnocylindrales bacterium]|nr:HAMP domain-containing sensor histidine kinase [Candidatus Limnocylindrales bacterium]
MRIRWSEFENIFREFTEPAGGALSFYLEDESGNVVAGSVSDDRPAVARHRLTIAEQHIARLNACGNASPETVRLCWAACERELAHQLTIGDMADATARLWRQTNALLRMSESTNLALEPGPMLSRVLGVLAHATNLERGCALVRVAGATDYTLFGFEHPRQVPASAIKTLEKLEDDVTMLPGEGDTREVQKECASLLGRRSQLIVVRIATDNARYGYLLVPFSVTTTVSSEDLKVLGAATRIVGIAVENSHTLLRERESMRLEVENEMLSNQAREMEEMLHVVSHDLRSPMTAIYGFMHIALDELDDLRTSLEDLPDHEVATQGTRIAKPLEDGIRSVERLNGMVQRLLDFSRIARLEYHFEPLEMSRLVGDVVDSLGFHMREKGIKVSVGPLPNTDGDRVQVEVVFRNLVDNAVKYMGDGKPREIEIGSRDEAGETVYFVRDTGMGMTAEQCGKAFLPFRRFRADAAPGEGIGLSFVRKIVERHGGRIWCESTEGVGTSFQFTLKAGRVGRDIALSA